MVRKFHDFDWMAAPGLEEELRDALSRLPQRISLPDVYQILRWAKFWQRQDEKARGVRRRSRSWLDNRSKVPQDLHALEVRILRVYAGADAYRRSMLFQLGGRRAQRRHLGPGTERVLAALDQLRAAIANDPVLSAPIGQGRRGQPGRPWLWAWAEPELRRCGVTKEAALELLRLIGLKPPE